MRRILAPLALATVGMVASATAARAEVGTNDTQAVSLFAFVPCADGGAGEVIAGDVRLHTKLTSTINGNNISGTAHFQPQGGALVGQATGDIYRPTGVTHESFKNSLQNGQFRLTLVNNFRLIGPGPANNLLVHETIHVTVNANGDTTVTHDKPSINCK
jgi:hypothetical protein